MHGTMAASKWSVLAACVGIYGDALKRSEQLSQEQLEGVASALAVGSYLALPAGLAYDALQHRHGAGPRSAARPAVRLSAGVGSPPSRS
jgi:hypothetical protein